MALLAPNDTVVVDWVNRSHGVSAFPRTTTRPQSWCTPVLLRVPLRSNAERLDDEYAVVLAQRIGDEAVPDVPYSQMARLEHAS